MSFHRWLQNLRSSLARRRGQRHHSRRGSLRTATHRLHLEPLEDRCLLSFIPAASFPVDTSPQAVATADFNNDGHLDLATANRDSNTVSVLLGDGQGGFGAASPFAAGTRPQSLAVGDFDNDGNLDLVTTNQGTYPDYFGRVIVLLGNGNGAFQPPVSTYASSGVPQSVAVGDFNADGNLDLAVATVYYSLYGEAYVEALLGDGHGNFATSDWQMIGSFNNDGNFGLAVADLNGDGRSDVVKANAASQTVSVLLGNVDGTLSYISSFPTGNNTRAVAVADFTGDGIPDVAAAGYTRVAILRGYGDGSFDSPIVELTNNANQLAVATADFNGDGRPDVVTVDEGEGTLTALLGLGSGMLSLVGDHAVGLTPRAVAVGDFNGDGRPDTATANAGSNTVSVLLNDGDWSVPPQPPPPSIAISDATVTEGNTGTINATFTLTLSHASTVAVLVHYDTVDITAAAGSDYTAVSGDVIIPAGQTSQSFTVAVKGDRLAEPTETFVVNLSAPTNVTIGDGQGIGTILDNEPRISVGDATKKEGNGKKTTLFVFTVTLSAAYDQAVTLSYRTVDGTATTGDSDYIAKTGTLTFAPGETTKTITIEVKGDSKREANETFYLDLFGNSSNSQFTKTRGIGTILNDD